jgi:hypothetical protein
MINPQLVELSDAASTNAVPEVCDNTDARYRLALLQSMAASLRELKFVPANRHRLQPCDPNNAATARAAANIAAWREYLPEDCITAMISDGWHWST